MTDLRQRVAYTLMFLRITEKEVRELAENTPEVGRELQLNRTEFSGGSNS